MKNYRRIGNESCGTCFSLEQDEISCELYCKEDESIGYDPGCNEEFLYICDDHNKLLDKKIVLKVAKEMGEKSK